MTPETLINRLQAVRKTNGVTLEQLGERAGLSKSTIWELEHGKDIRLSTLHAAAYALGLTLTITERL